MTDLTHFNITDIQDVLTRADAGDEYATATIQRNAKDWLWKFIGTVRTDRAVIKRLEQGRDS